MRLWLQWLQLSIVVTIDKDQTQNRRITALGANTVISPDVVNPSPLPSLVSGKVSNVVSVVNPSPPFGFRHSRPQVSLLCTLALPPRLWQSFIITKKSPKKIRSKSGKLQEEIHKITGRNHYYVCKMFLPNVPPQLWQLFSISNREISHGKWKGHKKWIITWIGLVSLSKCETFLQIFTHLSACTTRWHSLSLELTRKQWSLGQTSRSALVLFQDIRIQQISKMSM